MKLGTGGTAGVGLSDGTAETAALAAIPGSALRTYLMAKGGGGGNGVSGSLNAGAT